MRQYYQFNAHGDVIHRIDESKNILKTYKYDAFGIEIDLEPLDSNLFRYCGEYFDKETGEIYLRARYYNPAIGRFITQDRDRARHINLFDPFKDYQDVKIIGGVYRGYIDFLNLDINPLSLQQKDEV